MLPTTWLFLSWLGSNSGILCSQPRARLPLTPETVGSSPVAFPNQAIACALRLDGPVHSPSLRMCCTRTILADSLE